MATKLWSVASANGFNTTLNGSIANSDVTIVLTTATNLPAGGGILVIDRVNSSGIATPTVREYISYTGISTNTLTGVTRGVGNSTAQSHSSGAIVEEVLSVTHWLDLLTFLDVALDSSGNIDTIGANASLTTPKITTSINDVNGNEVFETPATASAVNHLKANNTITGSNPSIEAAGDDTNIDLLLGGKGTGFPRFLKHDGWIPANEGWTYASASTINVPSGAANKYQVGDRIKWTQTSVKYGVILTVADTLLTIAVNTNYVVTNAAISSNYYSHEVNPLGYPTWFDWSPVFAGFSADPSVVYCKYSIVGRFFTMIYKDSAGTSNNTNFTITLPVSIVGASGGGSMTIATDASARFSGGAIDSGGGTTLTLYKTGALGAWTNSGAKGSEQLLVTGAI